MARARLACAWHARSRGGHRHRRLRRPRIVLHASHLVNGRDILLCTRDLLPHLLPLLGTAIPARNVEYPVAQRPIRRRLPPPFCYGLNTYSSADLNSLSTSDRGSAGSNVKAARIATNGRSDGLRERQPLKYPRYLKLPFSSRRNPRPRRLADPDRGDAEEGLSYILTCIAVGHWLCAHCYWVVCRAPPTSFLQLSTSCAAPKLNVQSHRCIRFGVQVAGVLACFEGELSMVQMTMVVYRGGDLRLSAAPVPVYAGPAFKYVRQVLRVCAPVQSSCEVDSILLKHRSQVTARPDPPWTEEPKQRSKTTVLLAIVTTTLLIEHAGSMRPRSNLGR